MAVGGLQPLDPTGTLPEGRYQVAFNGVKSQEGVAFPTPDARYAVPWIESGSVSATSAPMGLCMGSGASTTSVGERASPTDDATAMTTIGTTSSASRLRSRRGSGSISMARSLRAGLPGPSPLARIQSRYGA